MNELKIFEHEEFGKVRTVIIDDKPYFSAKDVATALGYKRPIDAVTAHCRYSVKWSVPHPQSSDKQIKMSFIPEGDIYRLIIRSKLPSAERFEKWVFDEVLPSIRKHGAYMTDVTIEKLADNPDLLIELCNKLKAERQKNEELKKENTIQSQKLLEYEPKATYYDLVLQSKGTAPITVIAKDFGMTAQELNKILCDKKIQRKVSGVYVLNKKYADKGYTKSKTFVKNGMSYMSMYWTQSGRLFIYDTLKQIGILPLIESEDE